MSDEKKPAKKSLISFSMKAPPKEPTEDYGSDEDMD
jgi:hypothetical protein